MGRSGKCVAVAEAGLSVAQQESAGLPGSVFFEIIKCY